MKVTIRQIAARTGLSPITVSRVLGDKSDKHRPETRERVLRAAEELGYRINTAARAISTGRFGSVALLMSTEGSFSYLPGPLMDGIQEVLEEQDLHLTVARLSDEKLTDAEYVPQILREWTADGVLINYHFHIPGRLIELVRRYNVPSIWINSKQECNSVHPDDFGAGRRAAEHLLRLGHRRIAYLDYAYDAVGLAEAHYSAVDRQGGYEDAMRRAGREPRTIRREGGATALDRLAACRAWLSAADRPTAVLTYSSPGPIILAAARLGLRVPQDLSVVTFEDAPSTEVGLPVTTMIVPQREVGRAGARMLLERIEDPETALAPRTIPFELAEGASCAPPAPGR